MILFAGFWSQNRLYLPIVLVSGVRSEGWVGAGGEEDSDDTPLRIPAQRGSRKILWRIGGGPILTEFKIKILLIFNNLKHSDELCLVATTLNYWFGAWLVPLFEIWSDNFKFPAPCMRIWFVRLNLSHASAILRRPRGLVNDGRRWQCIVKFYLYRHWDT